MATNVAVADLVDAMVTQLGELVPPTGSAVTTARPVRTVQRYVGAEFTTDEGFKRGIAGRTPALRVRYTGSRSLRTTIGRRIDRVESAFSVVVASDNQHGRDERHSPTLELCETVRHLVSSRQFSLPITPMCWQRTEILRDDDKCLAMAVTFTARHRADYTIEPGDQVMETYAGVLVNADVSHSPAPHLPTLAVHGTTGATSWGYALVGIDEDDKRTLISPTGSTAIGNATLSSTNYIRLTWPEVEGVVSYEISRVTAGGTPATTGVIGETENLYFNDTGIAVSGSTEPDSVHVEIEQEFEE